MRSTLLRPQRVAAAALALCLLGTSAVASAQVFDEVFYPYKPNVPHGKRDIEFHWSDTYRIERGDPPGIPTSVAKTLDQLARHMDEDYSNPMGAQMSDLELVYNYFFPFNDTYVRDTTATAGFRIPAPGFSNLVSLDPRDTTHLDVYIYRTGERGNTGGSTPSVFWSTLEDTSTGHPATVDSIYHWNSVMFPGPVASASTDTTGTGWTKADRGASAGVLHEFAHTFNAYSGGGMNEVMSSAAEQLIGQNDPPSSIFEVPYTWPLLSDNRNRSATCTDPNALLVIGTNYENWRSFAAYGLYNFRGADTSATRDGFRDDLFYKWAHATPITYYSISDDMEEIYPNRSLRYLRTLLTDDSCNTCGSKGYFHSGGQPLSSDVRLALYMHNWRVASYVNQPALAEGQYGFAPQSRFWPASNVNAWHSSDGCQQDDAISVPPEVTLSRTGAGRQSLVSKERLLNLSGGGTFPHPMWVPHTGAEYWVVRSDATLGSGGPYTLQVRIQPDSLARRKTVRLFPSADSVVSDNELKLVASVIGYTTAASTDSLWRHPEWATLAVAPQYVDVDSLEKPLRFSIPNFGTTYKAALVVITACTGRHNEPWVDFGPQGNSDTWYECNGTLGIGWPVVKYRASFAVTDGAGLSSEPTALANDSTASEFSPTWNPNNNEVAYLRSTVGGMPQLYRRTIGGSATLVLSPSDVILDPDWSPRGDAIAISRGMPAGPSPLTEIWTVTPGGSATALTANGGLKRYPAFCPNGRTLAWANSFNFYMLPDGHIENRWGVWTYDLGTGALTQVVQSAFFNPITALRWSPDGGSIWFTTADSLFVLTLANGAVVNRPNVMPAPYSSFDLHRSTGRIALEQARSFKWTYTSDGHPAPKMFEDVHRFALYDTTRKDADPVVYQRGKYFYTPRWSVDGTKVAYAYGSPNADLDVSLATGNTDHAPVFTGASYADVDLATCGFYQRYLSATDADGETPTYQALYLPPGATFSANRFSWQPDASQVGDWYVTFRALDGTGGLDQKVVRFTVYDDPNVCNCPHYPYCMDGGAQPVPVTNLPTVFALAQNQPNPFSGVTTIHYDLPRQAHVKIEIFDLLGRRVRTLVDADQPAAFHSVRWDQTDNQGNRVHTGVYMYRMISDSFRDQKKMLLLGR